VTVNIEQYLKRTPLRFIELFSGVLLEEATRVTTSFDGQSSRFASWGRFDPNEAKG